MRKTRATSKKPHGVRIISGQWRGRRLPVADVEGLRPSGDRLRETLFNWLQPVINGTHCLDLFAGSGVLGFEAVSRGASQAVLVEKHTTVARSLEHSKQLLSTDAVTVHQGDALTLCTNAPRFAAAPFNLVFIDPPWAKNIQETVIAQLIKNQWLQDNAIIYVETPNNQPIGEFSQLHETNRKKIGEALAMLLIYKKV